MISQDNLNTARELLIKSRNIIKSELNIKTNTKDELSIICDITGRLDSIISMTRDIKSTIQRERMIRWKEKYQYYKEYILNLKVDISVL